MSQQTQQSLKKYKIIVIGRSGVGKSTLLMRYVQGDYSPQKMTCLIDCLSKKVTHEDSTFSLQLWDSAGQERFRTIVSNYFSLSKAACVVFDISNEDSINDAKIWLQQLVMHCGNQIPKILLGNKCDIFTPAQLQQTLLQYQDKINELKQEYHCKFFRVSAKQGTGVNEAFEYLAKQIYNKNKQNHQEVKNSFKLLKSSIKISTRSQTNKKRCC